MGPLETLFKDSDIPKTYIFSMYGQLVCDVDSQVGFMKTDPIMFIFLVAQKEIFVLSIN